MPALTGVSEVEFIAERSPNLDTTCSGGPRRWRTSR